MRTPLALAMSVVVAATRLDAQNLQVYLVTMGEGAYYWEKFGHNALWFHDPANGVDVAYNWGTFDFGEPGFLRRILTGDTRYWVEGVPGPLLLEAYRRADRSILAQRLNLTPAQATRAFAYAQWNARDENKYYRYDYFRDNCSTRVRDVIDLAVNGALKAATANAPAPGSYRLEALRLVDDMKLTQFGIHTALAQPADAPLTVWQDMFAPARLRDAIRNLRVPSADGSGTVPLVAEERVLYRSATHAEREEFPTLWLPYLVIGLLLAAELLVVGLYGERSTSGDRLFHIEAAAWAFITGLMGLLLLLAWLVTQHVFWYRNENLLFLNPLALFLAVLIPLSARSTRWLRAAAICSVIVAMLATLALIVKGIPGFTQNNLALIFLFLPAHFAVAYGLWRRARMRGA